jgi:hypothetical protein
VLSVDGQDRTLGERVAQQIFVRKTVRQTDAEPLDAAGDDHRREQSP